jgi:methionyl-tRNA formyltransferase
MNVIFAGTPEFAAVALRSLLRAGFGVPLVLTQPDRPAGRGMKLQPSAVKQVALEHGLPVCQPRSLKLDGRYPEDAAEARAALQKAVGADMGGEGGSGGGATAMVVAAYGLILPQWVLDLPRLGCLNIHASLLPRWRGAAPIHRAIEAGDAQTGITLMQMDAGLDTGDMLLVERTPIAPQDTTGTLHDRLAALGGRLVVEALELAACGGLKPTPQPADGITYAHKIEKAEAQLDWTQPAALLERRVRAFNPFPGASTLWGGEALKVWRAEVEAPAQPAQPHQPTQPAQPGTVLGADATALRVQTGQGVLRLLEVQRAGGKRLPVADFLRGQPLAQPQEQVQVQVLGH